jgi:NarL family two-component system response regulator LiaR
MEVPSERGVLYYVCRAAGLPRAAIGTRGTTPVLDTHAPVPVGIQVLIADGHPAVRRALAICVEAYDDLYLAGEVASGQDAIRLCASTQPDVILLDVTLPDLTGAAPTRAIHEVCPRISVIAMCTFQEEKLAGEFLKAGAVSYLLKNVSADELAHAIRSAYSGHAGLHADLTSG